MKTSDTDQNGHRYHGQGTERRFRLSRLPAEYYQGDAVVHWTLSIAMRGKGWLNHDFHSRFREVMLHASARERFICPTYCLMPDHIHLIWMGLERDSHQRNGMKFLREHLAPALNPWKFQHQAHDHVLKQEERKRNAFAAACRYILANPIKAELIGLEGAWPFCGAVVPGYPTLHPTDEDFWPLFWRIYHSLKSPAAGNLVRPPIR